MPNSLPRTAASSTGSTRATCTSCWAPRRPASPCVSAFTLDGASPGDSRGLDVDGDGQGVVTGQRLYQLLRQSGPVGDRTFEIRFLDPGVHAYAFTFG